jgi:general stress protein 26
MDSINKKQPEQNHADLSGGAAVEQIKTIVDMAQSCFFCSAVRVEGSTGARPMNVRNVDDAGNLWFLSPIDSHKNQEIALDPEVTLYFQGSPHSDFLEIHGRATITQDKAKIKELWHPTIGSWFTEGIDDPRITVIKVTPSEGYYWDTKHGNAVAGIKIMIGALLGKTLDDSIEGNLRV